MVRVHKLLILYSFAIFIIVSGCSGGVSRDYEDCGSDEECLDFNLCVGASRFADCKLTKGTVELDGKEYEVSINGYKAYVTG